MSVRIRLQRSGRKKHPFYRIVVADAYANRDGKFVERIGHYDPMSSNAPLVVDNDRALYWLQQGAQPSDTVKSLLQRAGVWKQFRAPKTRNESVADA